MNVEAANVSKRFGDYTALDDASLVVPAGSLLALLGPSGSGKTTLLRVIAGLEVPDSGRILISGEDVTRWPPRQRNVGLVFQHYALFGHMSVFENVAFGLRVRGLPRREVQERVEELLAYVQLEGLGCRFPAELSGGQRQRVALARALAVRPKVLLLDEPFGALDAKVRIELRKSFRRLHEEMHLTSIFVTHDQEEAFEVADEVVVMNHGRIEQVGAPHHLFQCPANAFVADFLGAVNVLHGCVSCGRASFGGLEIPYPEYPGETPLPATAYLRNHEMELRRTGNGEMHVAVRIAHAKNTGPAVKLMLIAQPCRSTLHLELRPEEWERLGLAIGDTAYIVPRRLSVFVTEGPGTQTTLGKK